MGLVSRFVLRRMFGIPGLFGTGDVDPIFIQIIHDSPIYTMGTLVMILGTALILAGILLAIYLKKKK